MSRVERLATAPARLLMAAKRHGFRAVISFLVLTVRRRGLFAAVRLGVAEREVREEQAEQELLAAAKSDRSLPPDLHPDFRIGNQAWASWKQWVGIEPASSDPIDERAPEIKLVFIVNVPRASDQALDGERDAIRAVCPQAVTLVSGDLQQSLQVALTHEDEAFVVFLEIGDRPSADFARCLAKASKGDAVELLSFDMTATDGDQVLPMLLPGANPTHLREIDYVFGRGAVRIGALRLLNPCTSSFRSVALQWLERRSSEAIRTGWKHVSRPILDISGALSDVEAMRRRYASRGFQAQRPLERKVSAIICTKDKGRLTQQLVRSLLLPNHPIAEVIVIANNTINERAREIHEELARHELVTVINSDGPFNFSKLMNMGVRECRHDGPLLFLNDDLVPLSEDWIASLTRRLEEPSVGAVGPLLLYPDEHVQHAGMYLGFNGRAGHVLRGADLPSGEYLFFTSAAREVSCLTGAVLLTPRDIFDGLGGFDEQLPTYLQDVDYCLRVYRGGWVNVFEPSAVLFHMESASIKVLDTTSKFHLQREREYERFLQRWGDVIYDDPFFPRGFDPQDEGLRRLSGAGGVRPFVREGVPTRAVPVK